MSTVEVWPDTNTFLHFKSLDELDWSLLTGGAAEVTVTLCSAVMGELDDKKHRGDTAKLRERAKNSIGRLHKWRTAEIAPGVRLRLVADEPKVDWDREGLDPKVRDDRIIASVIAQGRGERRAVMTDDMNLGLKAEGRHIEVINPSDRLPDLKGQQEIIIADLHRQLAAARDKDPKLKLAFADRQGNESQLLRVRLERPSPLDETAIKSLVTEKKLELERVASAYREQQAINSKFWPVENEIAPYLKAIPRYLSEYEEWLREELSHNDLVSRTIKIKLVAANLGRGQPKESMLLCTSRTGQRSKRSSLSARRNPGHWISRCLPWMRFGKVLA